MRAAIAALEFSPGLDVRLVAPTAAPSGSSFANGNDAWGMQVLGSEPLVDAFVARAAALARPGFFDAELASIMARESEERFRDLERFGLAFEAAAAPGCFWPEQPTARLARGLGKAFAALKRRFEDLGGQLLAGLRCVGLLQHFPGQPVLGAALRDTASGDVIVAPAAATILALGGPAALFEPNVAGPGLSGAGYALLQRAGARLANVGFLQLSWVEATSKRFFPVQTLTRPGAQVLDSQDRALSLPPELQTLGQARGAHCPVGYGLDDAAIDAFLLRCAREDRTVWVRAPGGSWSRIALAAQAGNGGAVIDAHGQTAVSGLFACGECATGMHGANRIGGAMVLATQVFGARAGLAAAESASGGALPDLREAIDAARLDVSLAELGAEAVGLIDRAWGGEGSAAVRPPCALPSGLLGGVCGPSRVGVQPASVHI